MLISLLMNLGMFGANAVAGGKGDDAEDSSVSSKPKALHRQIIKPTGLVDRPRIKPAASVEARAEQSREVVREVAREAAVSDIKEFSIPEMVPISRMTISEIDAEIGARLRKKMSDDEDETMLFILIASSL